MAATPRFVETYVFGFRATPGGDVCLRRRRRSFVWGRGLLALLGCALFSLSAAADVAPGLRLEPSTSVVAEASRQGAPPTEDQAGRSPTETHGEGALGRGAVQSVGRPEPPKLLAAGRNARAARASVIVGAAFLALLAAFWMLMRWRKSRLYAQLAALDAREGRGRSEN